VTGSRPSQRRPLTGPFGVALALHFAAAALLIFVKSGEGKNMPPPVKMIMFAAPAGPRAVGVVDPPKAASDKPVPTRTAEAPKTATATKRPPTAKPKATTAVPKPTTPAPKSQAAPKAGGGAEGGKGTDVVNLRVDGIDFPFTPYLRNVVNQIMQRFEWDGASTFRADVAFLIKRDGTVMPGSIRVVTHNANYAFRAEATGAIEAAGNAKSFGPLPDGFMDDVLPVVFSFDPKLIRQ
jgi:periplasmic protein TonB